MGSSIKPTKTNASKTQTLEQIPFNCGQITVKKERQMQYQQTIISQLKQVRRKYHKTNSEQFWQQYKHTLNQIQQRFARKIRECPPLLRLIRLELKSLKLIHLQYQQINHQPRYQIQAKDIFSVIIDNQSLAEVTLIGIAVQYFGFFLSDLSKNGQNFHISKELKLNIDVALQFNLSNQQQCLNKLSHLQCFCRIFANLSHIKVKIILGQERKLYKWANALQSILRYLRKIRKTKLQICMNTDIDVCLSTSIYRSILFGEIALFTGVTELSFSQMKFSEKIAINDFMAVQQCLVTIFENNQIIHLKLYIDKCKNFPMVPITKELQSIDYRSTTFRKRYDFMREVIENSQKLNFIGFKQKMYEPSEWQIKNQLLSQLQTLIILRSEQVRFNITPELIPLRIKHLSITCQSIGKTDCFVVIFPRLFHLIYLELHYSACKDQNLLSIPSPNLEQLHLRCNNQITEDGLKRADSKWQNLRKISMLSCLHVSENILKMCKFRGLIELNIKLWLNRPISLKLVLQLEKKGIQVNR